MMLTRRFIRENKLPRYVCMMTRMKDHFYSTKNEIDPIVVELPELRLSEHVKKMKQRKPFAKNFFCGKYDIEFAAFPEPQTHERHGEFFEWLKPIEDYVQTSIDGTDIDKTAKIPPAIIEELKDLGVFRAAVPDKYNGLDLNYSEYGKLVETLSHVPVLGAYLAKQAVSTNFISNYASDAQKSVYLPRIANGECTPTLCITEDEAGSEGSAITMQAKRSDCGNFWILNGTKTYVANAENSDLFIVFADCYDFGQSLEDTISVFFVDRSCSGITIGSPVNTLGYRGLSLCDITFKNAMVPVENLVGGIGIASNSFTNIFSHGKQYIGAQAIGITKRYLKLLVHQMKKDENFNASKFKNDAVQDIVGKIGCSIYGMESALYLTTGIMDTVVNQDCDLEKCIVESYCVNACVESLIMSIHILGLSSQLAGNVIEQLLRDATCLMSIDGMKTNMTSVISLMGIEYYGNYFGENIRKLRNPWHDPITTIKNLFFMKKFEKLHIADNLHPTLQVTAELIEYSINKLKTTMESTIIKHGVTIQEREMELKRISDTASYLYVMAAMVARASRSYCLGIKNGEMELQICQIAGYILNQKIEQLIRELEDGSYLNGDCIMKNLSDGIFENDAYFVEHPLTRNF